MKKAWDKWNSWNLIGRILVFMVIGAVLGVLFQGLDAITMLGTLFVSALKAVAPVLVFFLVISALTNAKASKAMKYVIILYIVSTFCAAVASVLACYAFPITITLTVPEDSASSAPQGIAEVFTTLLTNIFSNPVDALANANYLGILTWAILIGIALRIAAPATKKVFADLADAVATVVRWVISLAPFGIMGLVYNAVSTSGLEIFTEYGVLILLLVSVMLLMAFVINPLIVFIAIHKNPYPIVLRALKESGLTAFFTRSSAANIPVNLELCRKMKLNEDNYSISIPLGATINMAGAAVTITVMSMVACNTLGISVDIPTAIILCVLAAASACGASGVAGGSLLLIPLACSLFGISADISAQVMGVGYIISVIQDSCETALNSSSDVVFAATAEYHQTLKEGKKIDYSEWEK
jgi:serine/threonine transporter